MEMPRVVGLILVAVGALSGCRKEEVAPPRPAPALPETPPRPPAPPEIDPVYGHLLHAQSKLPTLKVVVGGEDLTAEVAIRRVEIATGMMYRTSLREEDAMLFVFPDVAPRSFYMRNCTVPLSAAYIAPSGEILQLIDMQPLDESGTPSASKNVQFVLEVAQGWFTRHHIGPGTIVRTQHGTLQETFFGRKAAPR
jgi:uncharacterized membrane protein (UPF0127 family)